MTAETIAEIKRIQDITTKGKVEEDKDKDGELKQVSVVGFRFIGGTQEMDIVLIGVEGNHAINAVFNIVDPMNGTIMKELEVKNIEGISCKTGISEDKKTQEKWVETSVSFEYDGKLATMDTILDAVVKNQSVDIKFSMDQMVMLNLKSGEIKGRAKCKGCPIFEECPKDIMHNSLECKQQLTQYNEL